MSPPRVPSQRAAWCARGLLQLAAWGALLALLVVAPDALACPVCGGGGQNQHAFISTMVFLSVMPLSMIAAGVGVVWYLARQAEAEEAERDCDKVIYLPER